jgi:predicted PurR-regulated permease PerM
LRGLFAGLPGWLTALLDRFGLGNFALLQQRLTALLSQASGGMATQAMSLGQNAFDLVVGLCLTIYLAFFMIRDGEAWAQALRRGIPLPAEDKRVLFEKFNTVVRATVKGNLLVAALQGALGGLAFWFLDVSAPVLWAALMAVLSLLPAVGAALVWGPVAAYLFLTGAVWQGVALCAYGVLVIGLVDNLLRPLLVGKDTRLPDAVVLVATLGGMAVFGVHGFVLGPAIAAMAIAVWHLVLQSWANELG